MGRGQGDTRDGVRVPGAPPNRKEIMELGKAICIHRMPAIKDGKWVTVTDEFEVRVMAIVEGYAMVRRKGCMPFVCRVRDLRKE